MLINEQAKGSSVYPIVSSSIDWVNEKHIPELIKRLDDQTPCASVMLYQSSYIGFSSTVGNEAAFIIKGFMEGKYPPDLNSNRNVIDKGKIRSWWRDYLIKRN